MDNNLDNKNIKIDNSWSDDSLEIVEKCPVCGSKEKTTLYKGLEDLLCYVPGKWILYKCLVCNSAFINPRPNKRNILYAYKDYYTHESSLDITIKKNGLLRWFRRAFANGYRNYMYKTNLRPSIFLGMILVFFPSERNKVESSCRNLSIKFPSGHRLLDIGCGNGDFLYFAKSTGRKVVGIDFDEKAVRKAKENGLDVRLGDVDVLGDGEKFDIITLSQVIEHVHDPYYLLLKCYSLLNKNGYIWIDTPNLSSIGHKIYRSNWRGLEPPRHLVLFSYDSLLNTLQKIGFSKIENMPYRNICKDIFKSSDLIYKRKYNFNKTNLFTSLERLYRIKTSEILERNDPSKAEFITIKAWKSN
jgi:2-polyprenyl-3-methyl-5-hydroxy-6-metoxy-1,4-benzoquinol methylase